jgi:FtsX-like permease family
VSVVVALGVTLVAGTLIGGASLRAAVDREAAIGAPADFDLHPTGNDPITPALTDRLRARTELTHVVPYRSRTVRLGGSDVDAVDLDFTAEPALRGLHLPRPSPGHAVLSAFAAGLTGATAGDTITVDPATQAGDPPAADLSARPLASAGASVSARPLASAQASVSARPLASAGASVSARPLASARPSVSARPLASARPSVSARPLASAPPSVSARPSASAGRPSAVGGQSVSGRARSGGGPAVGGAEVRLIVAAVLPDTVPLSADLAVDPGDLTRLGAGPDYAGVLADAAGPGERARDLGRAAMDRVQAAAGGRWTVDVLADGRDRMAATVTLLVRVALGLVGLTVLVAVVGAGPTAALSVVERAGEAGLLRAIGLSRAGLRMMLTVESALHGVVGAGLGLALAVPYAWLAVHALGVSAPVSFPLARLAAVVVLLPVLTALAGVGPARRAARLRPVEVYSHLT